MSGPCEIFVEGKRFNVIHGDPKKISECPGLVSAARKTFTHPRDSREWEPLNAGARDCPNRWNCGSEMTYSEIAGHGVIFGGCPK